MNERRWFKFQPLFVVWLVAMPGRKVIPWIIDNYEHIVPTAAIASLLIGVIWVVFKRVPDPSKRKSGVAVLGPVELRDGARCLVCRDALSGDVIYCGSCHTPHHRECFSYVGACSVYACSNRTYNRAA